MAPSGETPIAPSGTACGVLASAGFGAGEIPGVWAAPLWPNRQPVTVVDKPAATRTMARSSVVWAPTETAAPTVPTLSVHAYSPPMTAMSYYEVTDRNTLRRRRTEPTDRPEPS